MKGERERECEAQLHSHMIPTQFNLLFFQINTKDFSFTPNFVQLFIYFSREIFFHVYYVYIYTYMQMYISLCETRLERDNSGLNKQMGGSLCRLHYTTDLTPIHIGIRNSQLLFVCFS